MLVGVTLLKKSKSLLNAQRNKNWQAHPELFNVNYPYPKGVKDIKWYPKKTGQTEVKRDKGVIEISVKRGAEETGLLKIFLVGGLDDESEEGPTLSDIRRWSSTTRRNTLWV